MSDEGWRVWLDVLVGFLIVTMEHTIAGGVLGGGGMLLSAANPSSYPSDYTFPLMMWGFGIGLTQIPYVLPTFLVALFVRRNVAAGVALGALVTFLLNGACFGVLCATM